MEYEPKSVLEQIVPLGVNLVEEITPAEADIDPIPTNSRGVSGLYSTNDNKVQKIILHIVGIAINTHAGSNALDCTTATHNQWRINLNNGSWADLVNGVNADGQMNDNDWRCPLEGVIHAFHIAFDVTSQITDIDGKIGLRLQNAKSEQSSLWVAMSAFLRVVYNL